jgi:transcriptional regulator with XRE-family HTH domain
MSREPRLDNPLKVKKIAYMKVIGEKIRWARKKIEMPDGRRMSQDDLSHEMGYQTRNTVSNWERGKNLPKGATMNRLAERLGRDPKWLFSSEHRSLAEAIREVGDQVTDKTAPIRISGTPVKVFQIASVEAVTLARPRGPALQVTDQAGDSLAFPVDQTTLDLLQTYLDILKQHI